MGSGIKTSKLKIVWFSLIKERNLLIEEFGKEYGTYFSILELISVGKTARAEMESLLESEWEDISTVWRKIMPSREVQTDQCQTHSRLQKCRIVDDFLNFWFRFIYRNRSAIETGNFEYIKDVVKRDYPAYRGKLLG